MNPLRVLLLVDRDLVPPETVEDDYTTAEWKTEYDVQVSLRELGHEVRTLGIVRDVERIREAQTEWRPHIAFNLLEDCYGVIPYDQNVVSYLELIGLPYTGCNPLGLQLSRDKALAKKLLTWHRIRTPNFMVCRKDRKVRRPKSLRFPLIVKSLVGDASAGIGKKSIVEDDAALADRVAFMHEQQNTDALVEELIIGRELYVGVMGNSRLETFPPWELIIENPPDDMPLLATRHVKWNEAYRKKVGAMTRRAEALPEGVEKQLANLSRRAYRLLNLCGYARLDFRLSERGEPYLLEANANPALSFGEDFSESAEAGGVHYTALLQHIINLGLRWHDDHRIE